jgi:tetratricopeptide (TPR) repeat protein
MNPETFSGGTQASTAASAPARASSRLESVAFYILIITIVLAPLAFLPTPYIVLDAVKTILIAIGTLVSAILYGVLAYKERSLTLPPRSITWTSILVGVSVVISSFTSVHIGKSFFGQGFELTTASITLIFFLAALVVFTAIYRKSERAPVVYLAITVPFIILAILHALRLLIGPTFVSLGILSGVTSTLVGTWYDLATYALIIAFIAAPALVFLPLSRRIRIIYWILLVIAFVSAFIINSSLVWTLGALAFLALAIASSIARGRQAAGGVAGVLKRIAWLPTVLFIIAGIFALWGTTMARPVIEKFNASYSTLTLPWQLTLDVDAGSLKNAPLFGIGPNHFSQAYLAFKPAVINPTYAWNAEFNYAFSLLATFVATQGILGTIAWALLLIFLGIAAVRGLRRLPSEPHARFAIVSSSFTATFLWGMSVFSVPSHVIIFYTYVATAIAIASIAKYGILPSLTIAPRVGQKSRAVLSTVTLALVVVAILWGVVYIKDAAALAYFGSGVKALTVNNNPDAADAAFARAYSLNTSDAYLQARAEAGIAQATKLASTITANSPASTSQAVLTSVYDIINKSVKYSQSAIEYDPTNYYNFVSEARVSEFASSIRMDKAYDNAVNSYTEAIKRNPLSPSLYLNLAQLQASQNKLDDALKTLGVALQVKNNYLDAIFLLSQVTAAQGNLKDAIIAAQVATQLNPQSAILFFQLGLLQYNNKDYASAAKALATAVELQSDYANAQYFLGLAYARLNDTANAITQFTRLAQTNPDNQEISFILTNLQSGKSPFADAKPPVTSAPEKRSSLPIKEKKK